MDITDEVKDLIRKFALQNAIRYDGKANPGNLIGKVIGMNPELKTCGKDLMKEIQKIVAEVNTIPLEDQQKELQQSAPEMLEKKTCKSDELKELDKVDKEKGIITRFAPSPSGPMHIGHAITGSLCSLYVKKYGGKFIFRIEDTNSDNIYCPAYDMLPEDADWLFGNVSEVWIQSERIEKYYEYVLKFLEKDAVYVCTCSQESFKECCTNKDDCPCRKLPREEQIKRWENMLSSDGYKQGEAVLRFKSDMQHKNPAMRDFPLARINESEHPKQGSKYRVWPLMNLSVAVDDIEAGMTHIIRAKDHADNSLRQKMMYEALGISEQFPQNYFIGRIKFQGLEISCSKTKERIASGEFSGWDDIRLPFLAALKRRGYQPGAFLKYAKLLGITPVDKVIKAEEYFKAINAFNKEIIDPIARRFFFISDPVNIEVKNAPKQEIELDLHPDNKKKGRKFSTSNRFVIEKADFEVIGDGNLYRLMDCLNFRKENDSLVFVSLPHEDYCKSGKKIVHWLNDSDNLFNVEVLMPDNTTKKGLGETNLNLLKVGDIIQFERFGFCRLDEVKDGCYRFWYCHK